MVVGDFFHQPYVLDSCWVFASCHYASLDAINVIVKRRNSPNRPKHKDLQVYTPQKAKGWNLKMDPNGKGDSFFGNPPVPSISRFQPFVLGGSGSLLRLANSCSSCLLPSTEEPLSSDHFLLKKNNIPISSNINIYDIFRVFNSYICSN